MMLIGVDYHPSFQTIAFFVEETGECGEQELNHSDGQAERFYRDLKQRGISVRLGMEATGYSRWFERLLAELGFELWIGDPWRSASSGGFMQIKRPALRNATSGNLVLESSLCFDRHKLFLARSFALSAPRYLYCHPGPEGKFIQAKYFGKVRDDIEIAECSVSQLKVKANGG